MIFLGGQIFDREMELGFCKKIHPDFSLCLTVRRRRNAILNTPDYSYMVNSIYSQNPPQWLKFVHNLSSVQTIQRKYSNSAG